MHRDIKEATFSTSFSFSHPISIFFHVFQKSPCTSGFATPRNTRSPPPDTTELRFMPPCFIQTWHFLEVRYAQPCVAFIFLGGELFSHVNFFAADGETVHGNNPCWLIYQVLFSVCLWNAILFGSQSSSPAPTCSQGKCSDSTTHC